MSDTGKIISALLAGFAAGAAAGILFAPEKGSDLRQKISDTLSDWSDSIAEAADSGMQSVNDLKERVEEKSGNASTGESKAGNKTGSQRKHA